MKNTFIIFLCITFYACGTKNSRPKKSTASPSSTNLNYATGFTVVYQNNTKLVEVIYPFQGATSGYKYLLVQKGESIPEQEHDVRIITIPVTSIVCTSTTHIPLLDYLDETEKLVGFPSTDYISSPRARKLVDAGKVQDLGVDKGLNLERMAMLNPDMVMGYTMSGDYGQFKKVEELTVPVVINAEYLEKHPLGRAEWLKFMALFFNKEKDRKSVV